MNIHFYFGKVAENCKKILGEYVTDRKINRLNRLLQHGNFELADLKISSEYFTRHNAFLIKLDLKIARKHLIAEEKSHDITKGFDSALDRLISQMRKTESIRHKK